MKVKPVFQVLNAAECSAILARNHVGRLAFVHERVVDIEPLGYAFEEGWLFLRSGYGAKLEALAHNPFVAFQVDEIRGPFDWRSVVAHGTIYVLDEQGSPIGKRQFDRAVKAVREIVPAALTPDDPTPERQIVYGLHVDRVAGRMAESAPNKPSRAKPRQPRGP